MAAMIDVADYYLRLENFDYSQILKKNDGIGDKMKATLVIKNIDN